MSPIPFVLDRFHFLRLLTFSVSLSEDMETSSVFCIFVLAVCSILISVQLRIEAVFCICGIAFGVAESVL